MKSIGLLIITNLAVILVASIVMSILGVNTSTMGGLLVFAAIFGFSGSLISLAISKWMAKKTMGLEVIEHPQNEGEAWLIQTVQRQASQAGIAMPEVAIYDSPEMNAFATGPSKNNSLVAVSTGLLYGMTQDEVEAVLAHEVSHIANGDMVTMALIQGVVNTFVIFAARVVAQAIDSMLSSDDEEGEGLGTFAYIGVTIVLELLFGILASFIVSYFSRIREYKADEGGARLAGKEKMIAALQRLQTSYEGGALPASIAAFGINSGKSALTELLMSHPPLEQRIEALRQQG